MNTSERERHSSHNHYSPLEKLFPRLREGNGVQAKVPSKKRILGINLKIPRVVESTVVEVETGAILGAPGHRHPRALIFEPPLNYDQRERGLASQRIWRETTTADTHNEEPASSYTKVKIIKRAA